MYKGYKVRRSKSLYKKKKGKLRKAIEAVALAIVVAGLGFVGFTVAEVLLNYVPPQSDEVFVDAPSATGDNAIPKEDITEPPPDDSATPQPLSAMRGSVVYAPTNVLASSAALSSYLETAKNDGFDAIVIEVKDEDGKLLYQSNIERVTATEGVVFGTLTAEQIANAAIAVGLRPIARVNTLKDHIGTEKINGMSYIGWIDNTPALGGKRWANPYEDGTAEYISEITAELHEAGFIDVILANTTFPKQRFSVLDIEILESRVTDPEVRFVGLGEFVNKVAEYNPDVNVFLEMTVDCFADQVPVRTAEILRHLEKGGELNAKGIVLVFTRNNFAAPAAPASNDSIEKKVKDLLSKIQKHSKDLEIILLLDKDSLSESDFDEITAAFNANGHENLITRN